jgi:ABC-type polysaccharide/polyol phosphate export permease
VLRKNPLFILVHSYRAVLLDTAAPDWKALGWLSLASIAAFLLGHAWFFKLRRSFADLI